MEKSVSGTSGENTLISCMTRDTLAQEDNMQEKRDEGGKGSLYYCNAS